jgi:hypothetical protein
MASRLAAFRQLRLYPIFIGHLAFNHLAYQLIKLEEA